jgi:hypothetical protein
MTNGEKLEQVFPDGICPFSKSWLDYEYKEPLTKINQDLTKNKSENPTSSTTKSFLVVPFSSFFEFFRVPLDKSELVGISDLFLVKSWLILVNGSLY